MAYQRIFEHLSPTRLIVGRGSIARVPPVIQEQDLARGLVVTDKGIVRAGIATRLLDVLKGANLPYVLYDQVMADPPLANVEEAYGVFLREGCDYLIGLGGGSPMDVAKCVGVAAAHDGQIRELFGMGKCRSRIPFLLCLPTTYGTGSEVTPFAVVTEVEKKFKASVGSPIIIPHVGILDADLSVALPLPIAGATGMDALTHAIESFVALTSTPISEALALHAIRMIGENLRQAAASDHNQEATERMLIASTLAGMAFSQTRLGNVHAMSHAVGGHFGVPHGVANAIILPRVMAFNLIACPEKFAQIAAALDEPIDGLNDMEAAEKGVEAVRSLSRDVGVPERLSDVGVKREGISALAEDALKSGNVLINPRSTRAEDIIQLFGQSI